MDRELEAEAMRQELEGIFDDENNDSAAAHTGVRAYQKHLHHAWGPADDALESKGGVMKEKSGSHP